MQQCLQERVPVLFVSCSSHHILSLVSHYFADQQLVGVVKRKKKRIATRSKRQWRSRQQADKQNFCLFIRKHHRAPLSRVCTFHLWGKLCNYFLFSFALIMDHWICVTNWIQLQLYFFFHSCWIYFRKDGIASGVIFQAKEACLPFLWCFYIQPLWTQHENILRAWRCLLSPFLIVNWLLISCTHIHTSVYSGGRSTPIFYLAKSTSSRHAFKM